MDETPDGMPRELSVGIEDQRQAAAAQSEQLAVHMAELAGVGLKVHGPDDCRAPAASQRVLDDWVQSLTGDGPKGLCKHLRGEHCGPRPCGGFPFMPGGLFCWECLIAVMQVVGGPDCPEGGVPCPGCGLDAPLFWGSATIGMHTLLFGLCRVCQAEDELSESID